MSSTRTHGASASVPVSTSVASPWSRGDVQRAAVLIALGCVVWAIGWYRVAGRGGFSDQIAPLNVAVLGVLLAGAGQLSWFHRGRRAVDTRRRVLLGDDATPALTPVQVVDLDSFVGSERLYHRAECPMAADRDWPATSRAEQETAGRVPCGWCEP